MCCTTSTRKKCFYAVLIVTDIIDLLSDWLFYYDLKVTEKGLVYGPPEEATLKALLAFCIVGTAVFVFDALVLGCTLFRKDCLLNTDWVSLLAVMLGDLPQMSINVYIAYCREEPISYFQLVKASVVMAAILVRIFIAVVQCRRHTKKTSISKGAKCVKGTLVAVLILNLALATCVFVFTQTKRHVNGELVFSVPENVIDDKYDDLRYFENVSVFFHHPYYGSKAHWVHVMSINDIRGQQDISMSFIYRYEKNATHLMFALWVQKLPKWRASAKDYRPPECYEMDMETRVISAVNTVLCQRSLFIAPTSVYATFQFTPPGFIFRRKIFGDIQYNFKVKVNGTCDFVDIMADREGPVNQPTIHYYRLNNTLANYTSHHLLLEDGQPHFFRSDQRHLVDIAGVWRTGFGHCESLGNLAPTINRAIAIDCDEW